MLNKSAPRELFKIKIPTLHFRFQPPYNIDKIFLEAFKPLWLSLPNLSSLAETPSAWPAKAQGCNRAIRNHILHKGASA